MPTQRDIAAHLGLDQAAVSRHMAELAIDWRKETMDAIRLRYCAHLRTVAAGHKSQDGLMDLTQERAMTEQIDRQLKQIQLAEKLGQVVNLTQLEPELARMVGAFRSELLARDDKLKAEVDALYGIDLDPQLLNEHTRAALSQLARYDPRSPAAPVAPGAADGPAHADEHGGLGAPAPALVA